MIKLFTNVHHHLQVKKDSTPPLSLYGQLLWREFFYTAATNNSSFDKMKGNPVCVQIPWDRNPEGLAKWAEGRTGFPWIDAIMTQLRQEGWVHHLAQHAVACFLTRGDLWISWEEGMKVRMNQSQPVSLLRSLCFWSLWCFFLVCRFLKSCYLMQTGASAPAAGCGSPAVRFSSSFFTATALWALADAQTPAATTYGQSPNECISFII